MFKYGPDEVSLTQYVTYDTKQLAWDDSIVPDANISLCGPLVHRIEDLTSGSAIPLTTKGDPFWTNDLTLSSSTEMKTLDVQTDDLTKAAHYTLNIEVSYLPYTLSIWPCSSQQET